MADQRTIRIQMAHIFIHTLVAGAIAFAEPLYAKVAYHTSILSGEGWVLELLDGHPERMHTVMRCRHSHARRDTHKCDP